MFKKICIIKKCKIINLTICDWVLDLKVFFTFVLGVCSSTGVRNVDDLCYKKLININEYMHN